MITDAVNYLNAVFFLALVQVFAVDAREIVIRAVEFLKKVYKINQFIILNFIL